MTNVKLVNQYWIRYREDIFIRECEGSRLKGLEESELSLKFRLAAVSSIAYMLYSRCRCGFDPWQDLKASNFRDIADFDTQRIIRVLGAVFSQSSEQVLKAVAVAIYSYKCQNSQLKPLTNRYSGSASQ